MIPLSLADIKDILDEYQDNPTNVDDWLVARLFGAQSYLKYWESMQILDENFYKLFTLSAVFKPDLFYEEYLKEHIKYLFRFFRQDNIYVAYPSNVISITDMDLKDGDYYYGIMNNNDPENNYTIYYIPQRTGLIWEIKKSDIDNLSKTGTYTSEYGQNSTFRAILSGFVYQFYLQCKNFKENEIFVQSTIKNMEKIGNLHYNAYNDFMDKLFIKTVKS
jgi:hypothetical protein